MTWRSRLRRLAPLRRSIGRPAPTEAPVLTFGSWEALGPGGVVVVCHRDWRGVRTAAHATGAPVVEVTDAGPWADSLAASMRIAGTRRLVVHGFPPGSPDLLAATRAAGIQTRVVLHSSMTQHGAEAGEARVAEAVLDLARAGAVGGVGFVKEGLAEAFSALGHPAHHVPNRLPRLPAAATRRLGDGLQVGVFAEPFWRKNVVTQLGAVALLDGATAHVLQRPDVAYLGGLPMVEHGTLPWEEFIAIQSSVDLNLQVTLSECQPMSPVESYLAGVPCLMSRTSGLFRSDPDLWELTSLAEADDPSRIAVAATRLLARRDEAVTRARAWLDAFDAEAAQRWDEFIA